MQKGKKYFQTFIKKDFSYETENCIFVGISPEQDNEIIITEKQLKNIVNSVKKASEKNIPAFIFCHYQLSQTIDIDWKYASLGSESKTIKNILEKYNGKVLFFSGHTHRGLIKKDGGSIVTSKNVTYVSTPSICKPDTEHYEADNDNIGTGFIIKLIENDIYICEYDFMNKKWLEEFKWKK